MATHKNILIITIPMLFWIGWQLTFPFQKATNKIIANGIESLSPITQEKAMVITYEAASRGYYLKIIVDQKNILYYDKEGRDSNIPFMKICKSKEWKSLTTFLENTRITSLPKFKAPSTNYTMDRVPLAHLTISVGNKKYNSNSFDHGNPPLEIKPIVNYMISLSPTIE